MKKCVHHFMLILAFLFIASISSAQKLPTPVSIHEHMDFMGSGYSFKNTEMSTFGDWWNKNISAVRVPEGYKIIAYQEINYQGASIEITGNWTPANNKGWDNKISSMRVIKTNSPVVKPVVINKPIIVDPPVVIKKPVETEKPVVNNKMVANNSWVRIRYYDSVDFKGDYEDIYIYEIAQLGNKWDNKIGSIQVPEGSILICYDSAKINGTSIEITGNWTATGKDAWWNNRITSYRIMKLIKEADKPIIPVVNKEEEVSFEKQFIRMSTKQLGKDFRLDYSPVDKKFYSNPKSNGWRIVPVAQNKYKILFRSNGKYWALGSTPSAFPRVSEDSSGMYQFWQIEKLPDGYYKISNWGLVQNNSPYPSLFYDSTKKSLFLTKWDEAKSFNGRWSLLSLGFIPIGEQPDQFDRKDFTLVSASTNKPICLTSYLNGGDAGTTVVGNCPNQNGKINFIKTFSGDYFITMNLSHSPKKYFYLDENLRPISNPQADIMNPNSKLTWKIKPVGNGTFRISNTYTSKVIELSKTAAGNLLYLIAPANRVTQEWMLLQ